MRGVDAGGSRGTEKVDANATERMECEGMRQREETCWKNVSGMLVLVLEVSLDVAASIDLLAHSPGSRETKDRSSQEHVRLAV